MAYRGVVRIKCERRVCFAQGFRQLGHVDEELRAGQMRRDELRGVRVSGNSGTWHGWPWPYFANRQGLLRTAMTPDCAAGSAAPAAAAMANGAMIVSNRE